MPISNPLNTKNQEGYHSATGQRIKEPATIYFYITYVLLEWMLGQILGHGLGLWKLYGFPVYTHDVQSDVLAFHVPWTWSTIDRSSLREFLVLFGSACFHQRPLCAVVNIMCAPHSPTPAKWQLVLLASTLLDSRLTRGEMKTKCGVSVCFTVCVFGVNSCYFRAVLLRTYSVSRTEHKIKQVSEKPSAQGISIAYIAKKLKKEKTNILKI